MFPVSNLFLALSSVHTTSAAVHHLFVGTFGQASLYTVAFDDEALTLDLVKNSTASAGHSWIAFDHAKKNVYAVAGSAVASYSVQNDTSLRFDTSIPTGGNCSSVHEIYVEASKLPPYSVYATPFGGDAQCGTVLSVLSNGTLSSVAQNYTYLATSGVHGLAFSPDGKFTYSADDGANSVWTHSVDPSTGALTYVDRKVAQRLGADPRHAAVHPGGEYLYVIYEGTSELAVYSIDNNTGIPAFANITYPLLPSGYNASLYWADEVALSFSGAYLWATNRGHQTGLTGYISAFSLSSSGAILEQLFVHKTTTSGGAANSVAPADFSDEFVALTDSEVGAVEMWRLKEGSNGTEASVVASVSIKDAGCCANAIWYD